MKVGALVTTLALLSASTYGYSFSDVAKKEEDTTTVESTGLTTNEESRIYGGSEANVDKYPYLASIRIALLDMNICGGALIAPQYILTAGHCIKTDELPLSATFGTNSSSGAGELTVPIVKGFRHPLYNKKKHLYDVGLLKLEKPVKRKMAKLCAEDGSDNKVGTMGTVLGWGKTETSGSLGSPFLKQLTIPVISNAECGKFKKYVGRVTEGMLCAGTGEGEDTCNGDSGGPLIVDDDIIIGCVSWGSKCGEQAGIYTRLTYVMDYIKDILAGGDGSKFGPASGSTEQSSEASDDEDDDEGSESGSLDLSWLFASESDSGSGSVGDIPDWLLKYFEGSGSSVDLTWLLSSLSGSGSDFAIDSVSNSASEGSGSEDAVLVKGKATKAPKAQATKTPVVEDSESGSKDLFASESNSAVGSESASASEESGSEDTVLVKGKTKNTKATKATKAPVEEDSPFQQQTSEDSPFQQKDESASTSTSTSTSGSESDENGLVHQSEQSELTTTKHTKQK